MVNSISRVIARRRRLRPAMDSTAPSIRLLPILHPTLGLFSVIAIICVGWVLVVRRDISPPNPFSTYNRIFPGQEWNAEMAKGFSCQPSLNDYPEYCTSVPLDGPFALITVTMSDRVVKHLDFVMRPNTLVMGNLPLTWDRPKFQIYQESVLLNWENLGVSANAWSTSRHFNYFMALTRVSFSRPRP